MGIGYIGLELNVGSGWMSDKILINIYYVSELDGNLLSVSSLASKNLCVFIQTDCTMLVKNEVIAVGHKHNTLYILDVRPMLENLMAYIVHTPSLFIDLTTPFIAFTSQVTSSHASLETWHCCLAHP